MKVLHTIAEFRQWRSQTPNSPVAFVPTMGALHEGHASLVRHARQLAPTGKAIASIFVNPTQFGPAEDFTKYPRTLDADCTLLMAAGCDAVFVPTAEEIYGSKQEGITVDPGTIANVLEGAIRPGHFRGVCTVVAKLLNITQPTHLLLGQKDFQQLAVLRKMVADLNMPHEVVACPTIRESDGLAMSSRNRYLTPDERQRATAIFQALTWAKTAYEKGERNPAILEPEMKRRIESKGLTVQYALAAHATSLDPWNKTDAAGPSTIAGPCVLLVAAKLGTTRLIDNLVLTPEPTQ